MVWRVAPSSVLSMADPKAALKSRPWGAFFIGHRAGPGLPGDMRPGDDDQKKRPKAAFQSRRWVAFLQDHHQQRTTKIACYSKTTQENACELVTPTLYGHKAACTHTSVNLFRVDHKARRPWKQLVADMVHGLSLYIMVSVRGFTPEPRS